MSVSQRSSPDAAGLAAKQSNAITTFRQRDTEFLQRFPVDVASAKNLILSGLLVRNGDAIAPAETLLDAAFDGENNHLDGATLALSADAVLFLEQLLTSQQQRYGGKSILQILTLVTR